MDVFAGLKEAIQKQREANIDLRDGDRITIERDGERYSGTISYVEDETQSGIITQTRFVFTIDTD